MSDGPGAIILLYHRVTKPARDPQLLCVSPEHFRQQIEVLSRVCRILPVSKIVEALRQGRSLERAAAMTFDDGYLDNLREAAPILGAAEAPATIFSTAGRNDEAGEFFWDELDRIFLSPGTLPGAIGVQVGGAPLEVDLGESADYDADQAEAHRGWNVLRPDDPTPRHRLYRELCGRIHSLPVVEREKTLMEIRMWAGMDAAIRQTHRMMSAEQMQQLTRGSLVELGGHTVDHPRLSSESLSSQREQVVANRKGIVSVTGRESRGFAYPFGTRRDYAAETTSIVKEAGYDFACSNFAGGVNVETDPYQLPRLIVRDWAADEFERRLTSWLAS